ncbi:hypothetical protein ES288_A03G162700v1 [Gossypium darwinii]|uniref:Reverse transcriptase zinc-binding domain-containing protein n=1 Tax=Gossypium darwinii TaxID=34276 RepID=A0A5D2H583_GOSDA|nr:hypothetical protein ES288_A03G162700v1 [Gossypium darwinii]
MGRQIFDGILIANEVIHSMKIIKGNGGNLIFKLDFSKARWLHQGDPLSSFLFILVTKVLHLLLEKAGVLGLIEGIHGAVEKVVENMKFILCCFEIFSGLSINFKKSCIVGIGVNEEFLYHMAAICKCKKGVLPICYLGLPLGADPRRVATWEVVVERFRKKLSGWKCRTMSWATRIVLINAVLSSLPIYFMRNFLWGGFDGKRKMAKLWRLVVNKKALWSKVILAKYGSNTKQWRFCANNLKDMSTVWRGIVENSLDARVSRWLGDKDFCWKVGNGKEILFWGVIWCGNGPLKLEFPQLFRLAKFKNGSIFDYSFNCGFSNFNWEVLFVRPLLAREVGLLCGLIERVSCVVLVPEVEDLILWAHDNKVEFPVKQLTKLLIEGEGDDSCFAFDKIWRLKVPPRVHNFLWLLAIDRVPTKDFLIKRGVKILEILNVCPWCNRVLEKVDHVFFGCNFIAGFWKRTLNWWDSGWKVVRNFEEFYSLVFKVKIIGSCKSLWLIAIAAFYWSIWLASNEMVKWCYPPHGWLKFIVSGIAFEGAMDGGVMRDEEGIVRALFSGPNDACDAETAELGAIITALDVFIDIDWKGSGSLIIETDLSVAYNWILEKSRRLWSHQVLFADLERRIACVGKLSFSIAEVNGNEMVESLAPAGMSRPSMFKAWW